jgi:Uma2 family endonuclease
MPMLHYSDKPEIEYLAGRRVAKVSPRRTHSLVQAALLRILDRCAGDRGEVGPEWRVYMSERNEPKTQLVPDASFISYERLDPLTDEQREKPPFAPDVAVEVRSPSDRPSDVEWKMRAYLKRGSVAALDVLPATREIRAFTEDGVTVFSSGDEFALDVIPWLRFPVAEAFAKLDRR